MGKAVVQSEGVYTDITSICTALKQDAQKCDQILVSICFIKSSDGTSNEISIS